MWAYFIVSLWHSFTTVSHTWQANSMIYYFGDPFQITFSNKNCNIWAWRTKWLASECKYCIDFWDSTMALIKSTHTQRHHSWADISYYSIQGSREWKLEWGLRFKQREKQVERSKPRAHMNNIVWRLFDDVMCLPGDTVCLYMSATSMSVFGTATRVLNTNTPFCSLISFGFATSRKQASDWLIDWFINPKGKSTSQQATQ